MKLKTPPFGLIAGLCVAISVVLSASFQADAQDSRRFSVEVSGQGADVILIPGLASGAGVWDETAKRLAATHRVHVVQVAGFGGAPVGGNAEGEIVPALADDLGAYAAKFKQSAIIGHSLGGLLALEIAAKTPDAVGRILVVDALPFYPLIMNPAATVEMAKPQAAIMMKQLLAQSDARYAASAPMTAARLSMSEGGRKKVASWAAASDRGVVARAMYDDMVLDARPRLPAIKAKTTVLYAWDASMGVPAQRVDAMYADGYSGLASAKLKRIEGSYHFIMLDQPAAFAAEVDAFLR